ncbi:uncharacterized protein AtWU_02585 [Aspergillus tubingensis]|uniref:uncharacterized protein n=1 Tax=Aspergillus tubingensis TaxID=5068 RepID=UPI001577C56B|nr:uncharacterized protein AtWU_02585 [Aspergillus tubingensis]GFN12787.1 hypothetical protein AtWU_02585 [Aspergillus tubingensis]
MLFTETAERASKPNSPESQPMSNTAAVCTSRGGETQPTETGDVPQASCKLLAYIAIILDLCCWTGVYVVQEAADDVSVLSRITWQTPSVPFPENARNFALDYWGNPITARSQD